MIFLWVIGLQIVSLNVAFGQPSLTDSTPRGMCPGSTVELHLTGSQLQGPLKVWTAASAEATEVVPAPDGKSAKVKLTLRPTTPLGLTGIIVANDKGISDPLLLLVDDISPTADNGANHSHTSAQEIVIPAAVDGHSDGAESDYYSFTARAGQVVSIEVVAQRLASKMDPVIRVLDANLRESALADDDHGLGADCRLQLECRQAGTYFIEVRDNRFAAGGAYRLRVGDFPLVATPMPLGGRNGSIARVKFTGRDAGHTSPVILAVPRNAVAGSLSFGVRKANGVTSTLTAIATSELPESVEVEPNDTPSEATTVTVPCAVSGVLQCPADSDFYDFAAAKGTPIRLTSTARRFGSPAYVFMTLYGPDGTVVAETKVTDREELSLTHTASVSGIYRVAARDLNHRGGADFAYRIELKSGPDFSLALKNDKSASVKAGLPQGDGTFGLTVVANRFDYDGPIELELEGPDQGFQLHGGSIPAKQNEIRLWLSVPAESRSPNLCVLRIVGTASIEGQAIRRQLHTDAVLRAKWPEMLYPPGWCDGLISTATIAAADPLFDLRSEQETLELVDGSGSFRFQIDRKDKAFKADLNVFVEELPPELRFSVETKADSKDQFVVKVSGGETLRDESLKFRLAVVGEHAGRGQSVLRDVPLRILGGPTATD